MATLRPFRQVNEHDIIGLFAYSTADLSSTTVASKGAVVKIESGWKATADLAISSDIGASFNNVTSPRFNVPATVTLCGQTDTPIGIILQDVKNLDENGEPLKFNPRKAAEIGASIPGQTVPIATKGLFLLNGIAGVSTSTAAGTKIHTSGAGALTTGTVAGAKQVGILLGANDDDGNALALLNFSAFLETSA
jgi:hypothetical protein